MKLILFLIPFFLFSSYEFDLTKAYDLYIEKKYKLANEKLDKINIEYKEKDWRFYSLKGEISEIQNLETEALKFYTIAIALNQTNEELFKRIYEIYTKLKKPFQAFDFIRLYLKENPNDKKMRFKAMLLAKRLGEEKYFEYSKKKLGEEKITEEEFSVYETKWKQKKYFELENDIEELKLKYPFETKIYKLQKKLFIETKNKSKLEENFLEQAILFTEQERVILEIANFYKEEKKYLRALNLYRKYFFISLHKENILEANLFLKEIYRKLNRSDFLAFDEFEEIFQKENKLDFLKRMAVTHPENREIYILGIYFSEKEKNLEIKNFFKEKLKIRDEKNQFPELLNIYSIFLNEKSF